MIETLPEDRLSSAIESNVEEMFKLVASCIPNCEFVDTPALIRFSSSVCHPMANIVVRTNLEGFEAEAVAQEILADYMAKGLPMLWFVGPRSSPGNLSALLKEFGGKDGSIMPGMAACLEVVPTEIELPRGVELFEVETAEALAEWSSTLGAVFHLPEVVTEIFTGIARKHGYGERAPFRYFSAYLYGKSVAVSALHLSEGVAGIYCVGTLAEARRMGIGAAVTLAPMLAGRMLGCRYAVLQSSEAGFGVYRKLGFCEYCQFQRYAFNLEAMSTEHAEFKHDG